MENYLMKLNKNIEKMGAVDNLIIAPLGDSVSVRFIDNDSYSGASALKDAVCLRVGGNEDVLSNLVESFKSKKTYIFSKVNCGTIHEACKKYGPFVMELPENNLDEEDNDLILLHRGHINSHIIVGSEVLSEVPMSQRMNELLMNNAFAKFSVSNLEGVVTLVTMRQMRERELKILENISKNVDYLTLLSAQVFGDVVDRRLQRLRRDEILTNKAEARSEWDLEN